MATVSSVGLEHPARPLPSTGSWRWSVALAALAGLALLFALAVRLNGSVYLAPSDNSVEAGFARDMSTHHSQAVEMAEIVRDRTVDSEVRLLATDIALTQQAQIGRFQGWLDAWGLLPTGSAPAMAWMGHAGGAMPGLAMIDDILGLQQMPGTEADIAFLRLMIRHHQGGVAMAEALLARGARPEVERQARGIIASQQAEIATMQEMLRQRGSDGADAGAPSAPMQHPRG